MKTKIKMKQVNLTVNQDCDINTQRGIILMTKK